MDVTDLDDAIAAHSDELERIAEAAQKLNDVTMINVEEAMKGFAESRIRMERIMLDVLSRMGMNFGSGNEDTR